MLLHRFITTLWMNVNIQKNSRLRKNSTHMKEKTEKEMSFSTTFRLEKCQNQYCKTIFYTYWINILVEIINITTYSTVIMSK